MVISYCFVEDTCRVIYVKVCDRAKKNSMAKDSLPFEKRISSNDKLLHDDDRIMFLVMSKHGLFYWFINLFGNFKIYIYNGHFNKKIHRKFFSHNLIQYHVIPRLVFNSTSYNSIFSLFQLK